MRPLIHYVRRERKVSTTPRFRKDGKTPVNEAPYGVVVALENGNIGWALCSKNDTFCKKTGKRIAFGRAKSNPVPNGTKIEHSGNMYWFQRDNQNHVLPQKMVAPIKRMMEVLSIKPGETA